MVIKIVGSGNEPFNVTGEILCWCKHHKLFGGACRDRERRWWWGFYVMVALGTIGSRFFRSAMSGSAVVSGAIVMGVLKEVGMVNPIKQVTVGKGQTNGDGEILSQAMPMPS